MSISITWSPFFQSDVRRRGRARQLANQVTRLDPEADELLRAEVVEDDDAHMVTVAKAGRVAVAECDCDAFTEGRFCEHIWAALMDVQYSDDQAPIAEALTGLSVRPPKARKRDDTERPRRHVEPEWVGRLSLLRPGVVDRQMQSVSVFPLQRQVCYTILPQLSSRHNGLVIELRQRTAIATGWSKPKPLKIGPDTLGTLSDSEDRELCALIIGATCVDEQSAGDLLRVDRSHATYRVAQGARRSLLKRMIATGRCFIDMDEESAAGQDQPVQWDGDAPWVLWAAGRQADGKLLVEAELRRGDRRISISKPDLILGGGDGLVIRDGKAAAFDDRDAFRWVTQFRDEFAGDQGEVRPMEIAQRDVPRFLDRLYMIPQIPELELPADLGRTEQHVEPVPHLDLFSPGSTEAGELAPGSAKTQLVGRVWFAYGQERINPAQRGRFVPITPLRDGAGPTGGTDTIELSIDDAQVLEIADDREPSVAQAEPETSLMRRDAQQERERLAELTALGLRHLANSTPDAIVLSMKQVSGVVAKLLLRGWVVSADRKIVHTAGPPNLSIASGIDWFELTGDVAYQGADGVVQTVSLPQILAAVRAGQHMITLDDGSHGLLPEQWLTEHGLLTAIGKVEGDHLKFRKSQAAILDALLDEKELTQVDDAFAQARERLKQFKGLEPINPAEGFHGSLRAYQREGLGWMAFLRWFGMGGILADDMGLGKTIQVLAVLQGRQEGAKPHCEPDDAEVCKRPSLIVVPRSVVFNWIDEAARFTPDLRVLAYTGTDREQLRQAFSEHDVIVTSYGLLRRDIEQLTEHSFDYIVLDEAQAIKNPQSQAAKAARLLEGTHRLALTGTPIENHLGDLWSIFEFLNPGMLGSNARFGEIVRASTARTDTETEDATGDQTLQQIAKALRPFILRRSKQQVLKDLPEKTEQTIICEMEPAQRAIYDELREYYRGALMKQLDASGTNGHGMGSSAFMVLEALLRLRQAACHPGLIDDAKADHPAAKLEALEEMLADIMDEGNKALVFSQFTSMLALVRKRLDALGIHYAYLDGQTRNRKEVVEQFQQDPSIQVFLISLKAGGVGLNLTAAEYVFILDPWWNPAVEAQAIDRTHRIGQTRPVFAYRMICEDTVEQRIIELQGRKRELADAIVGGEQNVLRNLSRDDLERLLS